MTLYGEGSNASSTNKESDLSQSSGERRTHSSEWEWTQTLRRERHAHRWSSMVRGAVLARPARSSGERRTHSSEWEGTQMPRRERHAHRWPSMVRGAVLARPARSSGERRTHSSEWEGTQMLRRERHAHRWPSMVRGAMLAQPTRRATYYRALGSGELIPQNESELRRSEGSDMLIGDPLRRGEQC